MKLLFRKPDALPRAQSVAGPIAISFDILSEEAPIVRIAQAILKQAIREKSTGIVIEARQGDAFVYYGSGDKWQHTMTLPRHIKHSITEQYKSMAGLDTDNTRRRQDGIILLVLNGAEYDVYVSCQPTRYGERVTLRLFPQADPPHLPEWYGEGGTA